MGQTASLFKLVNGNKNCEWIYRFWANPGRPWGGIVSTSPVLAPESALGSRPRVALSSAQVSSVYLPGLWPGNFFLLGLGSPPGAFLGRIALGTPQGTLLPADRLGSISLLDAGAGTARWTIRVLEKYLSASASLVDLSPMMLAVAREKLQRLGMLRRADLIEADISRR